MTASSSIHTLVKPTALAAKAQASPGSAILKSRNSSLAPTQESHDALVSQTQTWVAQTFFGTLLKQMRESPFRSEMMDGGRGGQAFGSMFDQRLADHMARGSGTKLVKTVVSKIEGKAAYEKFAKKRVNAPTGLASDEGGSKGKDAESDGRFSRGKKK